MDTLEYTAGIKEQFSELIFHLRDNVSRVEDQKGENLFKIPARIIGPASKGISSIREKT